MIRPDDFEIEIGQSQSGAFVRVTHKRTGNERIVEAVPDGAVGRTRDSSLAELRGLLFSPDEVRYDTGCGEDGDFIRVVHIPSAIERSARRRDRTHEELLDEVLEELWSRRVSD